MSDECTCHCHGDKGIKHTIPCCTRCHICKKRIRRGHWSIHMEKCDPDYKDRYDKIREKLRRVKENVQRCTPDHPYTLDRDVKEAHWIHTNSREIPRSKNDFKVTMECNVCGKRWDKEFK